MCLHKIYAFVVWCIVYCIALVAWPLWHYEYCLSGVIYALVACIFAEVPMQLDLQMSNGPRCLYLINL